MTSSDERGNRILDAAIALGPKIRASADEAEQGRRLPLHLVDDMKRADIFSIAMPKAWGGPELDFPTQLRVIEALSTADASAGWCTMIGIDGGYMTAYLDQAVAREMYRDQLAARANQVGALEKLEALGYLPSDRARALAGAYLFLRDVEHKLQVVAGLQTHSMPPDGPAMRALAARMGLGKLPDAAAKLGEQLRSHRALVAMQFRETLAGGDEEVQSLTLIYGGRDPRLNSVTAITFTLTGKAVKAKNGFRVSGRWPFASGCQHASWMIGHFAVFDGDSPAVQPNGTPETRFGFLPPGECEILDTWHTNGLRGSGSHDWAVKDRFIPDERIVNLQQPTLNRDGPLYLLPNLLLYKTSAVALGIAQGAIDEFTSYAIEKALTFATPGATKLRDEAYAQTAVAQAEALVSSARGFVVESIGDMWHTLAAGGRPSPRQRARARLAMAHASSSCLQAVELLYKANGGSSVYSRSPFDRRLRDMQTINQHTVVSLKTWEVAGRVLLGLPHNHGLLF